MGTIVGLFYGGRAEEYIGKSRKEAVLSNIERTLKLTFSTKKLIERIKKLESKLKK